MWRRILVAASNQNLNKLYVGLAGAFLIVFFALVGESRWRTAEQQKLSTQLIHEDPALRQYFQYIDPSWVPYPWQQSEQSEERLLSRIAVRTKRKLDRIEGSTWWMWHSYESRFSLYLKFWGAHIRVCEILAVKQSASGISACNSKHSNKLPVPWRDTFFEHYAENLYIDNSGHVPELKSYIPSLHMACNLTPLKMNVGRADTIVSPSTITFYNKFLGKKLGSVRRIPNELFQPGECKEYIVNGYGIDPAEGNVRFSSQFENEATANWFYRIWSNYHFTPLREEWFVNQQHAEFASLLSEEGLSLCGAPVEKASWQDVAASSCSARTASDRYLPGHRLANGTTLAVFGYPGLSDTQSAIDSEGLFNQDAVSILKIELARLHRLIVEQQRLERKWASRIHKFYLTFDDRTYVDDPNGPLNPGVSASSIPSETILGESLDVPSSLDVNFIISDRGRRRSDQIGSDVWSKYDLFEAVEAHGNSRKAGIRRLLVIGWKSPDGKMSTPYVVRYRFNPHAYQEFDQNVGGMTGFIYGLTFGVGDWLTQQRYAYARQIDPAAFAGGEIASYFVPIGPTVIKWVGRAGRGGRGGRAVARGISGRILSGAVEAALSAAYEYATAPPLQVDAVTSSRAEFGAKLGFAFGALFPPAGR